MMLAFFGEAFIIQAYLKRHEDRVGGVMSGFNCLFSWRASQFEVGKQNRSVSGDPLRTLEGLWQVHRGGYPTK
jgi:hypothetical protein